MDSVECLRATLRGEGESGVRVEAAVAVMFVDVMLLERGRAKRRRAQEQDCDDLRP